MIGHAVDALVQAGITEIMLVTGGAYAGEFLRLLGSGRDHGVERLTFAYQEDAGGIAEALALTEHFADGGPVVVLLGDNLFEYSIADIVRTFREDPTGAMVALAAVKDVTHLRHLGVAVFDDDRITHIIEKPANPPSFYAATGLYCYDNTVFEIIRTLVRSARGELEISDVNNRYIADGAMRHIFLQGWWGDAGESIEAYYSVVDLVRDRGVNKVIESNQ
jgi:glucose-1-phosphate thymidylyltransferase